MQRLFSTQFLLSAVFFCALLTLELLPQQQAIAGSITQTEGDSNASASLPGNHFLETSLVTLDSTGTVDIGNNLLLVDYNQSHISQFAQITSWIANAYDYGNWDLPGITSSTARADALIDGATGLGVLDNADGWGWTGFSGGQLNHLGLGHPILTESVVVKFTFVGDTNLDGIVDSADYANYRHGLTGQPAAWTTGDFNYDGLVNSDDLDLFKVGFLAANGHAFVEPTPEPATIILVGFACLGLMIFQRPKTKKTILLS